MRNGLNRASLDKSRDAPTKTLTKLSWIEEIAMICLILWVGTGDGGPSRASATNRPAARHKLWSRQPSPPIGGDGLWRPSPMS
jgi:hypothetical protein